VSHIDFGRLHHSFKGRRFVYMPMVTVIGKDSNKRHCVGYRKGRKLVMLGGHGGSMEYPNEADAKADVRALNQWSKIPTTQSEDA
jgi:hypothetical protein